MGFLVLKICLYMCLMKINGLQWLFLCVKIPSLTLFRLKIAANADIYCVCGVYDFFREKRNVLRNAYNPLERLIIPAIVLGVVSSLSVLNPALSCKASVISVLV